MKKFKKRSVGTNESLPEVTIFVDRNSGGRNSKKIIQEAGINVVLHDEYFKNNTTPDEVWVKEISERGWIMVSCDFKTANSPLFLHALKSSNARVFLLSGLNGSTIQGKAECVIKYYSRMVELCASTQSPFLCRIDLDGRVHFIDFETKLSKMHKSGRA